MAYETFTAAKRNIECSNQNPVDNIDLTSPIVRQRLTKLLKLIDE